MAAPAVAAVRAFPRISIKGNMSTTTSAPQFETQYTPEPRSRMRLSGTPLPYRNSGAIRPVGVQCPVSERSR